MSLIQVMKLYSKLSDSELADLLKSDDQLAFTEIYNRFYYALFIHVYNRLKDKDEAKDIVQELFSTLWCKREVITFTNLSNYLYTSARNRVLNSIAHKSVEAKYLAGLPASIVIEECITDYRLRERQLAAIIAKEIEALPPKMRQVFELSRKENLSHKQIAERLGLSEQSVRSHVKNALRILRVRLGLLMYIMFLFKY